MHPVEKALTGGVRRGRYPSIVRACALVAVLLFPASAARGDVLRFKEPTVFAAAEREARDERPDSWSNWNVLHDVAPYADYHVLKLHFERRRLMESQRERSAAADAKQTAAERDRAGRLPFACPLPIKVARIPDILRPHAAPGSRALTSWGQINSALSTSPAAISSGFARELTRSRTIGPLVIDLRQLRLDQAGVDARRRRHADLFWDLRGARNPTVTRPPRAARYASITRPHAPLGDTPVTRDFPDRDWSGTEPWSGMRVESRWMAEAIDPWVGMLAESRRLRGQASARGL